MRACIRGRGEYREHEVDDRFACQWCGAFAERAVLAEVDRLRAWKAEAMTVHAEWEETWRAAGRPGRPGGSKAVGVRQEIARLRAAINEQSLA